VVQNLKIVGGTKFKDFWWYKPSDYMYYTIPSGHKITMTNNSRFLPKAALPSIYLSWKPFLLKLQTRSCADKKNLSTILCCSLI